MNAWSKFFLQIFHVLKRSFIEIVTEEEIKVTLGIKPTISTNNIDGTEIKHLNRDDHVASRDPGNHGNQSHGNQVESVGERVVQRGIHHKV